MSVIKIVYEDLTSILKKFKNLTRLQIIMFFIFLFFLKKIWFFIYIFFIFINILSFYNIYKKNYQINLTSIFKIIYSYFLLKNINLTNLKINKKELLIIIVSKLLVRLIIGTSIILIKLIIFLISKFTLFFFKKLYKNPNFLFYDFFLNEIVLLQNTIDYDLIFTEKIEEKKNNIKYLNNLIIIVEKNNLLIRSLAGKINDINELILWLNKNEITKIKKMKNSFLKIEFNYFNAEKWLYLKILKNYKTPNYSIELNNLYKIWYENEIQKLLKNNKNIINYYKIANIKCLLTEVNYNIEDSYWASDVIIQHKTNKIVLIAKNKYLIKFLKVLSMKKITYLNVEADKVLILIKNKMCNEKNYTEIELFEELIEENILKAEIFFYKENNKIYKYYYPEIKLYYYI